MKDSGSSALRLGDRRRGPAGRLPRAWRGSSGGTSPPTPPSPACPWVACRRRRPRTPCAARWRPGEGAKVTLKAGDKTFELDPRAGAGLALDPAPSRALRVQPQARRPLGQPDRRVRGEAETSVDRDAARRAPGCRGDPRQPRSCRAAMTFPAGKVAVVEPVAGATPVGGQDRRRGRRPLAQPGGRSAPGWTRLPPPCRARRCDRAVAEFAASGRVRAGDGQGRSEAVRRPSAAYAPSLSMKADTHGQASRRSSTTRNSLRQCARRRRRRHSRRNRETPRSPSRDQAGRGAVGRRCDRLDEKSVVSSFVPALTAPDRTAKVTSVVAQPKLTTAEAEKIKPREVVSTFTTYFPYNPPRTENITIAARTLNGTYVAPGSGSASTRCSGSARRPRGTTRRR